MTPREYQSWAVSETWSYFEKHTGNPVIAMPTGTGKSHVIAMLLQSIMYAYPKTRALMLTHVKELIDQNYKKFVDGWPTAPVGIYSAGLNKRESTQPITFAGIASVAKKAAIFGYIDIIFIDECDLVSPNELTMYNKFIKELKKVNPLLKVVGLTATPWRAGLGHITEGDLFTDVCVDMTGVDAFNWFIAEGYLVPLVPKPTVLELDTNGVHMRGGDYVASELQIAVDKPAITLKALREALEIGHDRNCWLVFASGVDHAKHIADELNILGVPAQAVYSGMDNELRKSALRDLASGKLRALVNNNILTTGYDNVRIDLILMLRPTGSSRLWVQMLGRGTRPYYAEGFDPSTKEGRLAAIAASPKQNCLVLDFAANVKKLGPINDPVLPRKKGSKGVTPAPVKLCVACNTYNHASVRFCTFCGNEFTFLTKLKVDASTQELIKGNIDLPIVEAFKVDHITYTIHSKVGSPPMLKATYYCGLKNFTDFVCVQHDEGNYALRRAREWWRERSTVQMPRTTNEALDAVGTLRAPTHLSVHLNQKYPTILAYCYDGTCFGKLAAADIVNHTAPTVVTTKDRVPDPNTIDLDKMVDDISDKVEGAKTSIRSFLDNIGF